MTRLELVTELVARLGNRTDLTTRAATWVNWALDRIARLADDPALQTTVNGYTVATTQSYALPTGTKNVFNITVIDATLTYQDTTAALNLLTPDTAVYAFDTTLEVYKLWDVDEEAWAVTTFSGLSVTSLRYRPHRVFFKRFPYGVADGTYDDPTFYTQYGAYIHTYPVVNRSLPLIWRIAKYPTLLSADGSTPDYERIDDVILYGALVEAHKALRENDEAKAAHDEFLVRAFKAGLIKEDRPDWDRNVIEEAVGKPPNWTLDPNYGWPEDDF